MLGPEGAVECSHGWSGGKAMPADAEPVDEDSSPFLIAPAGRRRIDASDPPGLNRDNTTFFHGLRSAPPVATTRDPFGAEEPALRLISPGTSKQKEVDYLNIHEDDQLDEAQFAGWVKQVAPWGVRR